MPALRELQAAFALAMLGGDERAAAGAVRVDGIAAPARLAVYRHHVFTSLTAALESTYPVVVALLDRRFFGYAADRYVRAHPPVTPCLFEYGASFPDFLARLPECRHLEYLPDVARLEWAMNVALHAPDADPLEPEALRSLPPVALHPSLTRLASPWPIDALWQANQPSAETARVDLDTGGVRLQVWRLDDEVVFRTLSPACFAFREALARGEGWAEAAEAARAADPAVDLAALVGELLAERALVLA